MRVGPGRPLHPGLPRDGRICTQARADTFDRRFTAPAPASSATWTRPLRTSRSPTRLCCRRRMSSTHCCGLADTSKSWRSQTSPSQSACWPSTGQAGIGAGCAGQRLGRQRAAPRRSRGTQALWRSYSSPLPGWTAGPGDLLALHPRERRSCRPPPVTRQWMWGEHPRVARQAGDSRARHGSGTAGKRLELPSPSRARRFQSPRCCCCWASAWSG